MRGFSGLSIRIMSDAFRGNAVSGEMIALFLGVAFVLVLTGVIALAVPLNLLFPRIEQYRIELTLATVAFAGLLVAVSMSDGMREYRANAIISTACGLVFVAGAWYALSLKSLRAVIVCLALYGVLRLVCQLALVVGAVLRIDRAANCFPSWALVLKTIQSAVQLGVFSLFIALGPLVVGWAVFYSFDGERQFALFTIGLQWLALVALIPSQAAGLALPVFRSRSAGLSIQVPVSEMAWIGLLTCLIAGIGSAVLSLILPYYGADYDKGYWSVVAVLGVSLIAAPAGLLYSFMISINGELNLAAAGIVWIVVAVVSSLILREFGAVGGAVALAMAYGVTMILLSCNALVRRDRIES